MRCAGRRGGEVKEIHSCGIKDEGNSFKKDAHKVMHMNSTEKNKRRYKSMKNKAKKALSIAMREGGRGAYRINKKCPNGMFSLVKGMKTDSKEVEGGRCMRGSDRKLCFSEKKRGIVIKDYMERIMNEENYCNHNVEGDEVEGPVVCVSRQEMLQTLNEMKTGKAPGHCIIGDNCW